MSDVEQQFVPIPLDAPDQFIGPELHFRINAAMTEEMTKQQNLKNSENYRMWNREFYKTSMRDTRRNVIQAWNDEQLAKAQNK